MIEPKETLRKIVQSWKSYTARWALEHNAELVLGVPRSSKIRGNQMFKNHYFIVLISLCMAGCISRGPDLTIYVAPAGSDNNPGTKEMPFATIARARDAVRAAKKSCALSNGVEVVIADGRYAFSRQLKLDAQDSGVAGGPVVYRAEDGAQVSITG